MFHLMKFVRPVGGKQNQFARLNLILFLSAGDIQRIIQYPQQLPFCVQMGRAVLHSVDKDAHTVNLVLRHDFQFFHGGSSRKRFAFVS